MPEHYHAKKVTSGIYDVLGDDGKRVARISSKFVIGESDLLMVNVVAPTLLPPAMARAVARAMTYVADDIEQGRA